VAHSPARTVEAPDDAAAGDRTDTRGQDEIGIGAFSRCFDGTVLAFSGRWVGISFSSLFDGIVCFWPFDGPLILISATVAPLAVPRALA
jgi:hypothetical protein